MFDEKVEMENSKNCSRGTRSAIEPRGRNDCRASGYTFWREQKVVADKGSAVAGRYFWYDFSYLLLPPRPDDPEWLRRPNK